MTLLSWISVARIQPSCAAARQPEHRLFDYEASLSSTAKTRYTLFINLISGVIEA